MQVDALKAADHSGYQQIIRPSRVMQAGLKSQKAIAWNDLRVERPKVAKSFGVVTSGP